MIDWFIEFLCLSLIFHHPRSKSCFLHTKNWEPQLLLTHFQRKNLWIPIVITWFNSPCDLVITSERFYSFTEGFFCFFDCQTRCYDECLPWLLERLQSVSFNSGPTPTWSIFRHHRELCPKQGKRGGEKKRWKSCDILDWMSGMCSAVLNAAQHKQYL